MSRLRLVPVAVLALIAPLLGLVASSPATAIVGGGSVAEGELPFMASLQSKDSTGSDGHFCGGSVVAKRWILTAAHCSTDTDPATVQVVVGKTDLTSDGGQTLAVDKIVIFPSYADTGTGDIALWHVTESIEVPAVKLVAKGDESYEAAGAPLTVAGWGTEFFLSPTVPDVMKKVDVDAVADDACYGNSLVMGFQPDTEICAQTLLGDSCQGDSGGPLFGVDAAGKPVQVGVVSYGLGCAIPGFAGVYGEVNNPAMRDFISATIGSAKTKGKPRRH